MQKKIFFVSLVFSAVASCLHGYYCVPSINDRFYITTDWTYLRRSKIQEHKLVLNQNILNSNGLPEAVLRTQDLCHNWNWKTGLIGKITYANCDNASLEALYCYVFDWSGRDVASGPASLNFPFENSSFSNDFTGASFAVAKYTSRLQNGELNYWGHLTPRRVNYFSASWIMGFRFLYLREHFDIAFTNGPDVSDYRINTKNYLYGAQVGGVFEVNPSSRWTWTVIVKGAAFLNDAHSNVFLGDFNNTLVLRDFDKKKWAAAFLIEGIGSLSYQMFHHMNIHIGYQAFQATGLALAPEQRDKDSHTKSRHIDVRGDIVVDGFFAGLTFSF